MLTLFLIITNLKKVGACFIMDINYINEKIQSIQKEINKKYVDKSYLLEKLHKIEQEIIHE